MLEDGGLAPPQACVAESSACITLESAGSSVMSLQGHTAQRERKVSVGSMGWCFRGGLNDQV